MADKHTLAFEIGVEEIPAFDLRFRQQAAGEDGARGVFDDARIPLRRRSRSTPRPRRLIVMAYGRGRRHRGAGGGVTRALRPRSPSMPTATPPRRPSASPRGKGLDVRHLERREDNGTEYVFAERKNMPGNACGRPAARCPGGLHHRHHVAPARCRWAAYARVLRRARCVGSWPCSTTSCCPSSYAGARVLATSRMGHRVLAPGPHTVDAAANLLDVMPRSLRDPHAGRARAHHPRGRCRHRGRNRFHRRPSREDAARGGQPFRVPAAARRHLRRGVPAACPRRSSLTPCSCTSAISRSTTRLAS